MPIQKIASLYKGAFSGIPSFIWWQSLVLLINRSGTMVVPFMSLYLTQYLHFSLSEAGIVLVCFGLGAIVGGFLGGWLTDRIGCKQAQIITLTGGGVLFILLSQLENYTTICFFTFLLSSINEAFRPANTSAIANYTTPKNRTQSYALARLATNTGWIIGGAMGGVLASLNYTYLFWVDGLTNLSAVILLLFLFPTTSVPSSISKRNQLKSFSSAYTDKKYVLFVIITCLFAIIFFQLFSSLALYYKNVVHLNEKTIGMLMAFNGIVVVLSEMILIYSLEGKRHALTFISIGTLLLAFSFVIFNIFQAGLYISIIVMLLFTVGEMLSMPFMNTQWVAMSKEENRGQYAGLYTMAWSVAQILAPTIGIFTADHFGFNCLWGLIGILGIITSVGFYSLKKYTYKNEGNNL